MNKNIICVHDNFPPTYPNSLRDSGVKIILELRLICEILLRFYKVYEVINKIENLSNKIKLNNIFKVKKFVSDACKHELKYIGHKCNKKVLSVKYECTKCGKIMVK